MSRLSTILREPSTWRGLGLALSLAGVTTGPELAQLAGAAVIAAISCWEIARRELAH